MVYRALLPAVVFLVGWTSISVAQTVQDSTLPPMTVLRLAIDDSVSGNVIANARVDLMGLHKSALTDGSGQVRFSDVPVGLRRVEVRAVGFHPTAIMLATQPVNPKDSSATLIELVPVAIALPTTEVDATRLHVTPFDAGGFEERRKMGIGHFLDEDAFSFSPDMPVMTTIASRIPGLRAGLNSMFSLRGAAACPVDVFIDGTHQSKGVDLRGLNPFDIGGVEFYTATSIPVQFNMRGQAGSSGNPACGVLVIWTRHV